jgi:hypothetical protein
MTEAENSTLHFLWGNRQLSTVPYKLGDCPNACKGLISLRHPTARRMRFAQGEVLRSGVRLQAIGEATLRAMMAMQEIWWFAAIMITRHGPDAAREAAKYAKEAIDARDNEGAIAWHSIGLAVQRSRPRSDEVARQRTEHDEPCKLVVIDAFTHARWDVAAWTASAPPNAPKRPT